MQAPARLVRRIRALRGKVVQDAGERRVVARAGPKEPGKTLTINSGRDAVVIELRGSVEEVVIPTVVAAPAFQPEHLADVFVSDLQRMADGGDLADEAVEAGRVDAAHGIGRTTGKQYAERQCRHGGVLAVLRNGRKVRKGKVHFIAPFVTLLRIARKHWPPDRRSNERSWHQAAIVQKE